MKSEKCSEIELEQSVMETMKSQNFKLKSSEAYNWFVSLFGEKISHDLVRSVCMLLSEMISQAFGRECYRRKKTCFFWANVHFNEIQQYLSNHSISVELTNGVKIPILPFRKMQFNNMPNPLIVKPEKKF